MELEIDCEIYMKCSSASVCIHVIPKYTPFELLSNSREHYLRELFYIVVTVMTTIMY